MSDFSSIAFSGDFPLLPRDARKERYFQCKDLPDDDQCIACVDGKVEADGLFVREDARGRFWNPDLNGWVGLLGAFTGFRFQCRFKNGCVVEVLEGDNMLYLAIDPEIRGDWSPSNWQKI